MCSRAGVAGKGGLGNTENITGAGTEHVGSSGSERARDYPQAYGFNPAGQRGHLARRILGGMRIPVSRPYTVGTVAVLHIFL